MGFVDAGDGCRLYYRDWGNREAPPIVFLSAAMLSGAAWQYVMVSLVDAGFRCVSYDRRGHGRSEDPGGGYDYDTLADDLAAVVDHLDLAGATLVGHSMAGGEIIRYITRHGTTRTARIALIAATLPFPLRTEDNPDGVPTSLLKSVRAAIRADLAGLMTASAGPYFGDGLEGCNVSQGLRDWTKADMLTTSLHATLACNRTFTETDFRAELAGIHLPALVVHGDCDSSIPLELSSAQTARLLPNAQLVVYKNGPHGLYLTHRDRLVDNLRSFSAVALRA